MSIYDLVVVGAGLIGSAAARHSSQWGRVCLVGPEEPKSRTLDDTRDVYGAHYDEGRMTRCIAHDPVWATLCQNSITRYRKLEADSGISFYDEVGALVLGENNSEYMNQNENVIKTQNVKINRLTYDKLRKQYPYLNVSSRDYGLYEGTNAGYISPRKVVKAQIQQAKLYGCTFIPEVVNEVSRVVQDNEYCMRIITDSTHILARKVLLATGAFTPFRNLLPRGLELDLKLIPITVAKVEISDLDFKKIKAMPGMVYFGKGTDDWTKAFPRDKTGLISWYMLPPVKYQDGKYYIKLGHFHHAFPTHFTTSKEMKRWFCSTGDKRIVDATADLIGNIIKGVNRVSYHGDCCVLTETPTERPYIDMLHSQLGVAIGGNGYGAKSSDEIGRIAAAMVLKNEWDSTIPRTVFQARFKEVASKL